MRSARFKDCGEGLLAAASDLIVAFDMVSMLEVCGSLGVAEIFRDCDALMWGLATWMRANIQIFYMAK